MPEEFVVEGFMAMRPVTMIITKMSPGKPEMEPHDLTKENLHRIKPDVTTTPSAIELLVELIGPNVLTELDALIARGTVPSSIVGLVGTAAQQLQLALNTAAADAAAEDHSPQTHKSDVVEQISEIKSNDVKLIDEIRSDDPREQVYNNPVDPNRKEYNPVGGCIPGPKYNPERSTAQKDAMRDGITDLLSSTQDAKEAPNSDKEVLDQPATDKFVPEEPLVVIESINLTGVNVYDERVEIDKITIEHLTGPDLAGFNKAKFSGVTLPI